MNTEVVFIRTLGWVAACVIVSLTVFQIVKVVVNSGTICHIMDQ